MSDRRQRGCIMPDTAVDYQAVPLHSADATEILHANSNATTTNVACCRHPMAAAGNEERALCCGHGYIIPVLILFVLVLIVLLLPWETLNRMPEENTPVELPLPCQLQLVETLPLGLNYTPDSPKFLSTFEAWQLLLNTAKATVDIAAPFWTLRGLDFNDSSTQPGEELFQRLLSNGDAGKPRLRIRIALNKSADSFWHADARIFGNYGAAQVVAIRLPDEGALHSKLWIVDDQHFYLGSANMDWRSLTHVKELGVLAQNCPQLTRDLSKIFKAYWQIGSAKDASIPSQWSWHYHTNYNLRRPMLIRGNRNYTMSAFISSSPPLLTAQGRTPDLDAILHFIESANEFIYIAVMDYYPLIVYSTHVQYWPPIDNALRKAAVERGVAVKLLVSWWKHSDPNEDNYLRSLQELSTSNNHQVDIQIRRFVVPSDEQQLKIPFGRVNHNAYMVTERIAYIGTSNWSGEYFTHTAGVGLVLSDVDFENNTQQTLRSDLFNVFERDWHSPYAVPLKHNLQL
ncbi:5'-3' exonuclease PLD3 [Drosophila sulfurigaster albostrigata]|uniref:5'-3' exonuclease PLD3 n=1 Tax=Drosophila sulfurigaster albostrigata TaxID=89887 RepID=UPI002D218EC6|nr:5'-3' exonuclease PLD3 [Drosophila sulfurigaster albostrigata]